MFQHSLQAGPLPKTMQLAAIKVIPKEQKDPAIPSSNRPLSIQNIDSKILANIMSTHLNSVLPKLVATDQSGFVQNRHSHSNI